ncbi:MAG: HAD family hydrolase [Gammaproteobacteria bacterium]|nr:MAG: HAD family hydrolase [Gammaproteobacteria bacterium]
MSKAIQVVAFDVFGTLVRMSVKNHPYRKVLKYAKDAGRKPRQDDARLLMTQNLPPERIFEHMGISIPLDMLEQFYRELAEELTLLTLFDDVAPVLDALAKKEIKVALCSNLAKPYGEAVDRLLSDYDFIKCLSYEVGAIKPELEIYDDIVSKSESTPSEILFVGDTFLADVEGPLNYGFRALHLQRGSGQTNPIVIQSLLQVMNNIY